MSNVNIAFQIPEDVDRVLREQAVKSHFNPDEYIQSVFELFLAYLVQNPAWGVRIAKLGLDTRRVAEDLFTKFVREQADQIALSLLIAYVGQPDATPQQRAAAFEAWARQPRGDLPHLSDEDISRESIYGGS